MAERIDYSRQMMIPGLSQKLIGTSNALIFGNNILAEFTAIAMVACGANVTLISSGSSDNSCVFSKTNDVFEIAQVLESLFFTQPRAFGFYSRNMRPLLEDVDYIFHVSGNSCQQAIELSHDLNVPISFIKTDISGLDIWTNPAETPELDEVSTDVGTALIAAGIAVHLFVNHICPDISYAVPDNYIHYESLKNRYSNGKKHSVAMVGAGGIGGALSFALAQYTDILIIYDGDNGEPTNRNRNPWLVNSRSKVSAIKHWIEKTYPDVSCHANDFYIQDRDFLGQSNCEAIAGCPDNWKARKIMYQAAMDRAIPYVNGGCSISGGCAYVSYGNDGPACLSCRKPDLEDIISNTEANSCSHIPMPSILPPNWITAGMMSHCVYDTLIRGKDCFAGTLVFDTSDTRLFSKRPDIRCKCKKESNPDHS